MAKKMWMVTEGQYSEYRVICVCASRKKARRISKLWNRTSTSQVEKVYLGSPKDVRQSHMLFLSVTVHRGGRVEEVSHVSEWPEMKWAPVAHEFQLRIAGEVLADSDWLPAYTHFVVSGTHLEKVKKVYSDMKGRLVAEYLGLAPFTLYREYNEDDGGMVGGPVYVASPGKGYKG